MDKIKRRDFLKLGGTAAAGVMTVPHLPPLPVAVPGAPELVVKRVPGSISVNLNDPMWSRTTPLSVTLKPQNLTIPMGGRDMMLNVRVAHDGNRIGFLLQWESTTKDISVLGHENFRDAVALQFPLGNGLPFYAMGQKGGAVNIWHWKADWEEDLKGFKDVEAKYPNMFADDYPFSKKPAGSIPSASENDKTFLTGWSAGNALSDPNRRTSVEELNAEGFGSLTSQSAAKGVSVEGRGAWEGGLWRVAMVRSLASSDPLDVAFTPGQKTAVAFAVWDGARGDRGGAKSVSTWVGLSLE